MGQLSASTTLQAKNKQINANLQNSRKPKS